MLLAIDAGNTNITFAVYDGDTQKAVWRVRTEAGRTADEYQAWLYPLFISAGMEFSAITDSIISSVIPDENWNLKQLCEKTFQTPAFLINGHYEQLGVPIKLPQPEQLGADRLMNAVAVKVHYQTPAVVIDFGTATNFDVVDADGAHCGGVLAPGVNLSLKALHEAASKLPKVSIKNPGKVIGDDTVSAMQSGLYWGYISMIEGIIKRIEAELGMKPFVLATGGLAGLFAQDNDLIDAVDEDLPLKGLVQIHKNIE